MTEFTTWRSLVDGDEISDIPDDPILRPESNDLDNFDGDLDNFSIEDSPTLTQDLVVRGDEPRDEFAYSTSGLDVYPESGQKFAWYHRATSVLGSLFFGVQDSDPTNNYVLYTNDFELYKDGEEDGGRDGSLLDSGDDSELVEDEWFEFEVTWRNDGIDIDAYEIDQSTGDRGNKIATLSSSDTDYQEGGIGFGFPDTSGEIFYQDIRVTEAI